MSRRRARDALLRPLLPSGIISNEEEVRSARIADDNWLREIQEYSGSSNVLGGEYSDYIPPEDFDFESELFGSRVLSSNSTDDRRRERERFPAAIEDAMGEAEDDYQETRAIPAYQEREGQRDTRRSRLLPITRQMHDNLPHLSTSASFGAPRVVIPVPNDTGHYFPFAVTETLGVNRGAYHPTIETNLLQFLLATFDHAYDAALHALGITRADVTLSDQWNGNGARVRALIYGVPTRDINSDEESRNVVIDTPNVLITNTDERTCVFLYDAMRRKFLTEYRNGSGENVELVERLAQITVRYEFMFGQEGLAYAGAAPAYTFNTAREARERERTRLANVNLERREQAARQVRERRIRLERELRRLDANSTTRGEERRSRVAREIASSYNTRTRTQAVRSNTRSGAAYGRHVAGVTPEEAFKSVRTNIYVKTKLDDFFRNDKDLVGVPLVEERVCFPMAFMVCGSRVYQHTMDDDGEPSTSIEKIYISGITIEEIISKSDLKRLGLVDTPFFEKASRKLILFHPRKVEVHAEAREKNQPKVYENEAECSEDVKKTWVFCAMYLHEMVEKEWGSPVDVNDLGCCMQAYSYVFSTSISIYNFASNQRLFYERAVFEETPFEERSVSMVLHGVHLSAIADLGLFLREGTRMQIPLRRLCDFCGCCITEKEFNQQQLPYEHQSVCAASRKEESVSTEITPVFSTIVRYHELYGKNKYQSYCLLCNRVEGCVCHSPLLSTTKECCVQCRACEIVCVKRMWNDHDCYMRKKPVLKPIPNDKLFVYDAESVMKAQQEGGIEQHTPILFGLMAMYDDREGWYRSTNEFMEEILTNTDFLGGTIMAHNGAGYDNLFITKYLEDNCIRHKTLPTPGSPHRYLSVVILAKEEEDNITFTDFCRIFPNSLRNIAKCFGLTVQKGDFPHRFSKPEHVDYIGPLPSVEDPRDWYSLNACKSAGERKEQKEFWLEQRKIYCYCHDGPCVCTKPKWNYFEQLKSYCRLDVVVLKEATSKYRDEMLAIKGNSEYDWEVEGIDPFRYTTMSQIALALFTQGKTTRDIWVSQEKLGGEFFPDSIHWLEDVQDKDGVKIIHAGNNHKKWFDDSTSTYLDGYCRETNTAYVYYDCQYHGCRKCCKTFYESGTIHPQRGISYAEVERRRNERELKLRFGGTYYALVTRWSHTNGEMYEDRRDGHLMRMRDFFYGGRTEVFAAYCDITKIPGWEILYIDVCSEYPFVCSHRKMPIGIPKCFIGKHIKKERLNASHKNPYFGFVRCRVRPNKKDIIGILPSRTTIDGDQKLIFDLEEKEGCWHTELIYLAIEHGYEILDIYEVWHWAPSQCSMHLMKGYMEFFLRMKQQADGWETMGKQIVTAVYKDKG